MLIVVSHQQEPHRLNKPEHIGAFLLLETNKGNSYTTYKLQAYKKSVHCITAHNSGINAYSKIYQGEICLSTYGPGM
jgi:hypothetical protein